MAATSSVSLASAGGLPSNALVEETLIPEASPVTSVPIATPVIKSLLIGFNEALRPLQELLPPLDWNAPFSDWLSALLRMLLPIQNPQEIISLLSAGITPETIESLEILCHKLPVEFITAIKILSQDPSLLNRSMKELFEEELLKPFGQIYQAELMTLPMLQIRSPKEGMTIREWNAKPFATLCFRQASYLDDQSYEPITKAIHSQISLWYKFKVFPTVYLRKDTRLGSEYFKSWYSYCTENPLILYMPATALRFDRIVSDSESLILTHGKINFYRNILTTMLAAFSLLSEGQITVEEESADFNKLSLFSERVVNKSIKIKDYISKNKICFINSKTENANAVLRELCCIIQHGFFNLLKEIKSDEFKQLKKESSRFIEKLEVFSSFYTEILSELTLKQQQELGVADAVYDELMLEFSEQRTLPEKAPKISKRPKASAAAAASEAVEIVPAASSASSTPSEVEQVSPALHSSLPPQLPKQVASLLLSLHLDLRSKYAKTDPTHLQEVHDHALLAIEGLQLFQHAAQNSRSLSLPVHFLTTDLYVLVEQLLTAHLIEAGVEFDATHSLKMLAGHVEGLKGSKKIRFSADARRLFEALDHIVYTARYEMLRPQDPLIPSMKKWRDPKSAKSSIGEFKKLTKIALTLAAEMSGFEMRLLKELNQSVDALEFPKGHAKASASSPFSPEDQEIDQTIMEIQRNSLPRLIAGLRGFSRQSIEQIDHFLTLIQEALYLRNDPELDQKKLRFYTTRSMLHTDKLIKHLIGALIHFKTGNRTYEHSIDGLLWRCKLANLELPLTPEEITILQEINVGISNHYHTLAPKTGALSLLWKKKADVKSLALLMGNEQNLKRTLTSILPKLLTFFYREIPPSAAALKC